MNASSPPAIELSDVAVRRGTTWVLRDLSLRVAAGTTAAVLGANGSGKSSLLRVISGYWFPTVGAATVLGETFGRTNLHDLRRRLRIVGAPGPYDHPQRMTVRQIVASGLDGALVARHDPAELGDQVTKLVAQVGLQARAEAAYGTLSTGERLRAALARARMGEPELLLLDEPTGGLDLPMREEVLELINRWHGEFTILLVTHHTEELPAATEQVIVLKAGQLLADGPPAQVLTDQTLSAAYDVPVEVHRKNGRFWTHTR